MSTAVTVSIGEYLETLYRPDCEYIDGELKERNVGELDHGRLQMLMASYLFNREQEWGIVVVPELRVQVKATRYRIPDITVILSSLPSTQILREPPFLCIEILSPRDSMESMQDRIDDYLEFGVPHVWVVDPRKLRAFHYTSDGIREAKDGLLQTKNPDIIVPLKALGNS